MLLLFRGINKKLIVKSYPWMTASAVALIAGIILFDINVMLVWVVLVLQSYTDITERHVFSVITWSMIIVQVLYCLICTTFLNTPLYMLIFPTLLIVSMSMLVRTYSGGDMELFILIMLHIYNMGIRPDAYMVYHLLITSVVFVIYMGIENGIRVLRQEETLQHGAFVPAMTAGYFVLNLLIK